jgi:hypothetical protein
LQERDAVVDGEPQSANIFQPQGLKRVVVVILVLGI